MPERFPSLVSIGIVFAMFMVMLGVWFISCCYVPVFSSCRDDLHANRPKRNNEHGQGRLFEQISIEQP